LPFLKGEHMPLQVIVGAQWGDEGKGRIVDWFAADADYTARFNGGDNAGHTVTVGSQIFKLHLIPSGIIHAQTIAVMGNGMVINPKTLLEEMDILGRAGISVNPGRLHISHAAHLITPIHLALDRAMEIARAAGNIGTTGRGIGPAYTDKASRRGLRIADLLSNDFHDRIRDHINEGNRSLHILGVPELDAGKIGDEYKQYASQLKPFITDTARELHSALRTGKTVLAESAQGTLLDVDHGTYPFVTSSTTTAPGVLTGLGLGLDMAREARVVGVVKAFQTRVGSGPFPTELDGEMALRLRGTGEQPWDEYGTTTGRPRRVGWLDGVLLRYAVRINGISELAVTKLDILCGLESLQVCTAYRRGQEELTDLPFGLVDLSSYEPVNENLPGWQEKISDMRTWKELPATAQGYLDKLATMAGVPVRLVSVGSEREQLISR
jgi:adenylosuccinate synthase